MGVDHQKCERCGATGVNGSLKEYSVYITDIDRRFEFCEECPDVSINFFLNFDGLDDEEIDRLSDEFLEESDHSCRLTYSLAKFLHDQDQAILQAAKRRLKVIKDRLPRLKKKHKKQLRREAHKKWLDERAEKSEQRRKKIEARRAEKLKASTVVL